MQIYTIRGPANLESGSSESTGDTREAVCQPEARDHVTITMLSDGRVSKLRKPDYLFSSEMSSGEPRSKFKYSRQNMLP